MTNCIKNIELPKDDSRCASILRMVISNLNENEKQRENESESRSAASSQEYGSQVYALRQKMFGSYQPYPYPSTKTESRSASVISNPISAGQGPNRVYEVRKVMFGSYS